MKILLVGSYCHAMYAPAFSYGFRQLGHQVIDLDYDNYLLPGSNFLFTFLNRIQNRYHYGFTMRKYNNAIINIVENEKPDFVFLYRCYHIFPSTLKKIKGKTVLMSYNNDDPFCGAPSPRFFRYHIANAYYCDINFVYRRKNINDYKKIGIENTRVLLPYYMTEKNKPINVEKDIPIAFIGHFENDGRDVIIKRLLDEGLPVSVFGKESGWRNSKLYKELESVLFEGKRGDEYNRTINRIKIALVFLSKINHDNYTRRCFEIPAAKTMMLAPYNKELNEMFPEDIAAAYYRNTEDLVKKCKYYLLNNDRIEFIANGGYMQLKNKGGSEVDRCREILTAYEDNSR